jgi:ATP-dependent RNA helicase RhlE
MSELTAAPVEGAATFAMLGLRPELLRAVEATGYTTPTPIQARAIPPVLAGEDVLAAAQTGTGKTAGFVLPVLQRLLEGNEKRRAPGRADARRPIRALVLTPTRELAAQVEESVRTYGRFVPLTSFAIFGGVSMNPQWKALSRGVDILVATPGRLLDHVGQRTLDLSQVEILILDEADRMLDMGFIKDIRRILSLLPEKVQNLLFSATFSDDIKSLADELLNAPRRVEVARQNEESALVTQSLYGAAREHKRDLLVYLMVEQKINQALIFTRTKHGADRLAKQLNQDGIASVAIHGNRSQAQRTHALAEFKAGRVRALVATDVAARGLDIQQLPHVINYEVPYVPEDYVHRIGRTGRAGSTGEAITLVSAEERKYLNAVEKLLGKKIERREAEGFMPGARPEVPAEMRGVAPELDEADETAGGFGARRPGPKPRRDDRPRPERHADDRQPTGDRPRGEGQPRPDRPRRERPVIEFPGRGDGHAPARTPRHKRRPAAGAGGGGGSAPYGGGYGGPRPASGPRPQGGGNRGGGPRPSGGNR